MPLLTVHCSVDSPSESERKATLLEFSRVLSDHLGKPEKYVMTVWSPRVAMTFGATTEPACYLEVKSIGSMTADQTRKLSRALSAIVERRLEIPPSRTYIEFTDAAPHLWGWNGDTFE